MLLKPFFSSQSHLNLMSWPKGVNTFFLQGSLRSHTMNNRMWVTPHLPWQAVSSHLYPWSTGCEWYLARKSNLTHVCMTNRMWVPLHLPFSQLYHWGLAHDQQSVSNVAPLLCILIILTTIGCEQQWIFGPSCLNISLSLTGSEWNYTILTICCVITSYVMVNSGSVMFPARMLYHILSYIQQDVSGPVFLSMSYFMQQ